MGSYALGKDVATLLQKIEALGASLSPVQCACSAKTFTEVIVRTQRQGSEERDGTRLDYKEFNVPRTATGKCQVNDRTPGVKIWSNGDYEVELHYECLERNPLKGCYTTHINYQLLENPDDEDPVFDIGWGLVQAAAHSTSKYSASGNSADIPDRFDRLNYLRVKAGACSVQ